LRAHHPLSLSSSGDGSLSVVLIDWESGMLGAMAGNWCGVEGEGEEGVIEGWGFAPLAAALPAISSSSFPPIPCAGHAYWAWLFLGWDKTGSYCHHPYLQRPIWFMH
jgi:hypothetical protein